MRRKIIKIIKTANYLKLAGSPRYRGQLQGDEFNQDALQERYNDNQLVEGKHIQILTNLFTNKSWDRFNKYIEKLKEEGHSISRINSMVATATRGQI